MDVCVFGSFANNFFKVKREYVLFIQVCTIYFLDKKVIKGGRTKGRTMKEIWYWCGADSKFEKFEKMQSFVQNIIRNGIDLPTRSGVHRIDSTLNNDTRNNLNAIIFTKKRINEW